MEHSYKIRQAEKSDCPRILELIKELAVFEKAENEVILSETQLQEDAFGENKILEILALEENEVIVGAAMIYEKYSTWKGRSIHLEDLIVEEKYRGKGYGTALFNEVVNLSKQRGYARMEWQVLDWNKPAIEFYKKYGALFLEEWIDCRLTAEDLAKL